MEPSPEREALQLVVEGVAALAGFAVVVISAEREGVLYAVAVAGGDLSVAMPATRGPTVADLEAEVALAEAWGAWRFVPHGRGDADPAVPSAASAARARARRRTWHPDDRLCAPLVDAEGRLRGVIRLGLPTDGRVPGPGQRRVLDHYATQALQALTTAQDRGDFARHHRQELALAEYRAQLVEVLAHELQTPLTAVLGHAELLAESTALPPELGRSVEALGRGVRRMSSMISDLLVLARADDPHRHATTAAVDLRAVTTESCDLLLFEAGGRGIELVVEVLPEPVGVVGDRADLDALVTNLVSNAIKYSSSGDRVTVALRRDGDGVVLEVVDQGLGISAVDQTNLFREFFRSRDPQVQRRPGTGLGLAIVERVVVRCRGRITVTSAPGAGSTFRVALPTVGR